MNKIILISAAALSVAACAKNEVIPVNSGENQEITFNVAPKTKATTAFDKHFKFKAWAYYLPGTVKWDKKDGDNTTDPITPATTPALYIDGAVISNTKPDGTDGIWKDKDNTYYWPKNGSLTFFAYSLNKDVLSFNGGEKHPSSHFECYSSTGITGQIDLDADPNVDFLVAEIAKDKRFNEDKTYSVNGVPTLFKHQLSWIVFNVKAGSYIGKTFNLKSIKFKNVSHQATYCQVPTSLNPGGFKPTTIAKKPDVVYMSTEQVIPTDKLTEVTKKEHWLYIPQTFPDNATIEVVYSITTKVPESDDVVETVTKTIQLNTLFKTVTDQKDTEFPGGWRMGKKYTINLTFTLDEILWDPAVEDWDPVPAPAEGYDVK